MVEPMRFVGVDLGWTTGSTGLAQLLLRDGAVELLSVALARDQKTALAWILEQTNGNSAIIAIDAPTIIRNPAGQRPGERQLNVVFRRHLLNCHPANLSRPFAPATTGFAAALEREGFAHAPTIEPRRPGRYQIEVFPHASIVRFFGLAERLRYKKGTVAERARLLEELRRRIATLRYSEPSLDARDLPSVDGVKGRARKDAEDRLDAVLCAYTGAYYWYWGAARNQVFGDAETGYLVVPNPPAPVSAGPGSTSQ